LKSYSSLTLGSGGNSPKALLNIGIDGNNMKSRNLLKMGYNNNSFLIKPLNINWKVNDLRNDEYSSHSFVLADEGNKSDDGDLLLAVGPLREFTSKDSSDNLVTSFHHAFSVYKDKTYISVAEIDNIDINKIKNDFIRSGNMFIDGNV
jgi:hypothetical protein